MLSFQNNEEALDYLTEQNTEAYLFPDLTEALTGIVESGEGKPLALYDVEKIVQILMDRDGMDYAGAVDFFYYNIYGLGERPGSPRFLFRISNFCGERIPAGEE